MIEIRRIQPPWTEEEVKALNSTQKRTDYHPFTCANRSDGNHKWTRDLGVLTATKDGWICKSCDYTQDWAYNIMLDMPEPYDFGFLDAGGALTHIHLPGKVIDNDY